MSFKQKSSSIKRIINEKGIQKNGINCLHQQIKIKTDENINDKIKIQQPIIIEKKKYIKNQLETIKKTTFSKSYKIQPKNIQPFIPVSIPKRQNKILEQNKHPNPQKETICKNRDIQINIEKDDQKNKQCLKKLFKKIHKLTENLLNSDKKRIQLQLELQNYKNRNKICLEHEKKIIQLENDKYRLQIQLEMMLKKISDKDNQINLNINKIPKQIIKQIIIEKPIQVIVEVPKHIPGPQRIVQKIIEIPKYIEVQKKVMVQAQSKEVVKTIQIPTFIDRPVYIDKPVYIDRPVDRIVQVDKIIEKPIEVPVEVPVQVPIEVPVYVDRPVVNEEWKNRIRQLQIEIQSLLRENGGLYAQNNEMKHVIETLSSNIQILRNHNYEKNREVQVLLQNSISNYISSPMNNDYSRQILNKYSVSSNPHQRII